ncbi:MAG TPA: hypothetical protein VMZ31_03185 [Phycisphaerae bacterium]|nr:hypothetical protein [Phycisphaerae bacterium]
MPRRHHGVTLIMVVFLISVIGVAGALAVQFAYMANVERRQALVETYARQLLASGRAWAQLNRGQLPASGQSRLLPAEQLVDPPTETRLRVTRCSDSGDDCIAVEVRVSIGRIAVNRSIQRTIAPAADAATASPD